MRLPSIEWLVAYGALIVELGGSGIGLSRWRRLGSGQRLVTVWLGANGLSDIAAFVSARIWRNSQPVARIWFLVCVVLGVTALGAYQHNRQRSKMFRLLVVMYAIAWTVLLVTAEPIQRYSSFSGPLHGLVILVAASMTIFRRVALVRRDLLGDPGFIIAVGLTAYAIPAACQTLVAQLWVNSAPSVAALFYVMSNMVNILVDLVLTGALLTPVRSIAEAPG